MLDELARKLEKRSSAARLIGNARSFATGVGSKADGTGSRKMASYRLIVEAWNKARPTTGSKSAVRTRHRRRCLAALGQNASSEAQSLTRQRDRRTGSMELW